MFMFSGLSCYKVTVSILRQPDPTLSEFRADSLGVKCCSHTLLLHAWVSVRRARSHPETSTRSGTGCYDPNCAQPRTPRRTFYGIRLVGAPSIAVGTPTMPRKHVKGVKIPRPKENAGAECTVEGCSLSGKQDKFQIVIRRVR